MHPSIHELATIGLPCGYRLVTRLPLQLTLLLELFLLLLNGLTFIKALLYPVFKEAHIFATIPIFLHPETLRLPCPPIAFI